ncbi:portal vertex protein [uncultured Caudovirales phage]|uniref:Portal vertex protein n=1 Tax=uncultured Caudovirales phage TaxID=2100421 RepID=A0A6J5SWN2_9CAUD|nr:portal vertex protein [uncultured Caudovirales phage]
MAGFLDSNPLRGLRSGLTALSRFGMKYDDLLVKNSQAIGYIEGQMTGFNNAMGDDLMRATLALSDTTSSLKNKSIAFFQLDYVQKRERLRDLASNGEIEFIIETITDDAIVYDEDNRFCYPNDLVGEINYRGKNKEERLNYQEKVIDKYRENFEKIYSAWSFDRGISAWQYFYQWLIEGHLAFEIIYDNLNNPKDIIGFKELDPSTLYPEVKKDAAGLIYLQWAQRDPLNKMNRTLTDSQIIYISYSNEFRTKRVSFVERLVRSFNLLRLIEHSKVIWHTMNAPIRLKTTVPVGTKSMQKAKEDVREFTNTLKEDISFDGSTGELSVDGKPNILFYKNYVLPVNDRGEKIEIEALEYPGPNLSGSELLKYFHDKLKLDSKLPYSRWSEGQGAYTMNAEGISREEIRYNKFVKRLRSAYKELITKPLYLQMCLDVKDLKADHKFANAVGMVWHDDNVFEEIKNQELLNKRLATLNSMKAVVDDENKPYFSTEYLIKEYLKLSDEDIEKNRNYLAAFGQAAEAAAGAGGAAPAGGGAPAAPAGETAPTGETSSEVGAKGQL